MNNKKVWCAGGFFLAQLLGGLLIAYELMEYNMLPTAYLVAFFCGLLILMLLAALCVFLPKQKENYWLAGGGTIAAMTLLLCLCGSGMLHQLNDTVEDIGGQMIMSDEIGVYIRKTEGIPLTAAMLQGQKVGICDKYDRANSDSALSEMEKEMITVEVFEYANVHELVDALFRKEVDGILLNVAYIELLEEQEKYAKFSQQTTLLKTYEVQKVVDIVRPEDSHAEEPVELGPISKRPFAVLISGNDLRTNNLKTGRSDVNILAIINPNTKQILFVSTPRDSYVELPFEPGSYDKLTHCGLYGMECTMSVLSDLYGVDVEFYGQVNFKGFEKLVNAIGGISIYNGKSFTAKDGTAFSKGSIYLDGAAALSYVRERDAFSGGDLQRGKNQMKVLKAIVKKVTGSTKIITNYGEILESLEKVFATNVTAEEMAELVKMQLGDMAEWETFTYSVTGEGAKEYAYSVPNQKCYVLELDELSIANAKILIQKIMSGEKLTEDDTKN